MPRSELDSEEHETERDQREPGQQRLGPPRCPGPGEGAAGGPREQEEHAHVRVADPQGEDAECRGRRAGQQRVE